MREYVFCAGALTRVNEEYKTVTVVCVTRAFPTHFLCGYKILIEAPAAGVPCFSNSER